MSSAAASDFALYADTVRRIFMSTELHWQWSVMCACGNLFALQAPAEARRMLDRGG